MNLVNELQVSAEKDDVLTVLRKAKRLASKLDRNDISEWLQSEISGYTEHQTVPDYRKITTRLAYNTNGFVPVGFGKVMRGIQELPDRGLTFRLPVGDAISTVLQWIAGIGEGNGIYRPVEEDSDYGRSLRSVIHFHPMVADQVSLLLRLDDSQLEAIPERVKDAVLDWALALERAGVTGEGLSFSKEEKQMASNVVFNITDCHVEQLNSHGTNQRSGT